MSSQLIFYLIFFQLIPSFHTFHHMTKDKTTRHNTLYTFIRCTRQYIELQTWSQTSPIWTTTGGTYKCSWSSWKWECDLSKWQPCSTPGCVALAPIQNSQGRIVVTSISCRFSSPPSKSPLVWFQRMTNAELRSGDNSSDCTAIDQSVTSIKSWRASLGIWTQFRTTMWLCKSNARSFVKFG